VLRANAFAASAVVLFASAAPPPAEPLSITSVDTSAYPRVAFDIVVPQPLSAVQLRPGMVAIDGGAVESLTAVDPRQIAIALVIDDRPNVSERVVLGVQGASVELVRNVGDGTQIALATPSGLRSALTPDRTANIARIAGITAGAPAVASLPQVVTNSIAELGASRAMDRHAIVALGRSAGVTDSEFDALATAIAETGTRLHLIAPRGIDAPRLVALSQQTGGIIATDAELVASVDAATAAIARRYRVVATVAAAGAHRIGLTVDDQRYAAEVDIVAPAPAPTTTTSSTSTSTSTPATPAPTTPAVVSPTTAASVPRASLPASQATPPAAGSVASPPETTDQDGSDRSALSVAVLAMIALGSGALTLVLLRRTSLGRRARRRAITPTADLGDATAEASSPSADAAMEVPEPPDESLPVTADRHGPLGFDAGLDPGQLASITGQPAEPKPDPERTPRRRGARRKRARGAHPAAEQPVTTGPAAEPELEPEPEQPAEAEPERGSIAESSAEPEAVIALAPKAESPAEPERTPRRRAARRKRARGAHPTAEQPVATEPAAEPELEPEPAHAPVAEQHVEPEPTPEPTPEQPVDAAPELASIAEQPAEPEPTREPELEPEPEPIPTPIADQRVEPEPEPALAAATEQRVDAEPEPLAGEPTERDVEHEVAPIAEQPAESEADRPAEAEALRQEPSVVEPAAAHGDPLLAADPEHELDAKTAADPEHRDDAEAAAADDRAASPPVEPRDAPSEHERPATPVGNRRAARRAEPAAPSERRRSPRLRPSARRGDVDDWIDAGHLRLSPSRQQAWTGRRHVRLTPHEYRVLELLVTSGSHGVTTEEIIAAGGLEDDPKGMEAADEFVAQLQRKTGFRRRDQGLRKQRVVTYYYDESDGP
jgi:hypothetical protein